MAGYLKIINKELQMDGSYLCEIAIPNREITTVYKSEILSYLLKKGTITQTTANKIVESLYLMNIQKLQTALTDYIQKSISYNDYSAEGFYHGLVLGLVALMDNQYKIRSNRESGEGRYDICLFPRMKKYPGIIIELKWEKDLNEEKLQNLAQKALNQIDENQYDVEMKEEADKILKLGIAFSNKKVKIICKQQ